MAGNNILTLALVGVGGYLVYEWFFAAPATAAPSTGTTGGTSTGSTSTTGTTGSSTTTTPPTTPAFNSLDQIYARLSSAVGSQSLTPDGFNFYLNQQLPSGKTAPDPNAVFTAAGFDRTQTMTLANYWGAVAPWLKTTYGLSGLGVFGGLGRLAGMARGGR